MTSMFLSKLERQVLYKKYRKEGMSHEDADFKINGCVEFLKDLVAKLRKQNIPEGEINIRFKEEFAKLCEMENHKAGIKKRKRRT